MPASRHEGDLYVAGNLSASSFSAPAGSVTNAMVAASAGIDATKLEHQHRPIYAQNGTASSVTVPLHCVRGATGTLLQVQAGTIAACAGAATITVDVKKNGTTVLSSAITLDNGNTARVAEAGTLSVTSLVAGDLLEVVITATAGGGTLGTGLWVQLTLEEDPS